VSSKTGLRLDIQLAKREKDMIKFQSSNN